MSAGPRVDVVVPGPEGAWIARALRAISLDVRELETLDASEDAAVVIAATTAPGFADRARPLASATRVIAVGWEPRRPVDGVVAYFDRPVPLGRLSREVLAALARPFRGDPSQPSHAIQATHVEPDDHGDHGEEVTATPETASHEDPPRTDEPPDGGAITASREGPPSTDDLPIREPTVQLEADEVEPALAGPAVAEPRRPSTIPPPTTAAGHSAPPRSTACFSPKLDDLLRRADRRLFPDAAPLDLRFPGGDEAADELVPDELLGDVGAPLEERQEHDPLEAFTFVGAPDLAEVEASAIEGASEAGGSSALGTHGTQGTQGTGRTPHTVRERAASKAAATATFPADLTRDGTLAPGGAMRLVWQLHDRGRPLWLQLEVAGGPQVRLGIRETRLVAFEGPAHWMVAAHLRETGRLRSVVDDEAAAETLLLEAVERGRLDRFELAARLRQAREALIHVAVTAAEAQFAIRPPAGELPSRPLLPGPLVAVAGEGARRRLGHDLVLRWLGHELSDRLVLTPAFAGRADQLGLEPELVEAFEEAADRPVAALLHGLAASTGAAGALFALCAVDAIRLDASDHVDDLPPDAVRALLARARGRGEVGDYFAVLELPKTATDREIAEAHRRLRRELVRLDLDAMGLESLEGERQEALGALDEAVEMLASPRLRQAYAAALDRS
ncbi:MAG: hypothetical protein KF901_16420 [Myxococcales bacterium]|nr:hypothetical protein [Myxococcales bacterium]